MLEDAVSEAFRKKGFIVFTRQNHCDVLAVKPDMSLAYLVECKDYSLSRKQQILAIRELNRNYTHALELLIRQRLSRENFEGAGCKGIRLPSEGHTAVHAGNLYRAYFIVG